MSWDGSGNFSRTKDWTDDRDAEIKILASRHDENDEELRGGIAACMTKNNESKPVADFRPNADNAYSLGSTALRWVNAWLSGVLKFKQATFAGTLQAAPLTANRTYTLPDAGGTVVTGGVGSGTPDGAADWLFFLDATDIQPKIATIASVAALPQFDEPAASTTVSGLTELATNPEIIAGTDTLRTMTPGQFSASKSLLGDGYYRFPGIIVQWGQATLASSGADINFPLTFPTACLGFTCSPVGNSAPSVNNVIVHTIVSTSVFRLWAGVSQNVRWIAVGH